MRTLVTLLVFVLGCGHEAPPGRTADPVAAPPSSTAQPPAAGETPPPAAGQTPPPGTPLQSVTDICGPMPACTQSLAAGDMPVQPTVVMRTPADLARAFPCGPRPGCTFPPGTVYVGALTPAGGGCARDVRFESATAGNVITVHMKVTDTGPCEMAFIPSWQFTAVPNVPAGATINVVVDATSDNFAPPPVATS